MRIVVAGAGVGGLACAVRLAHAGHAVTVLERDDAPGGKAGRLEQDGFAWDTGPSLLTMPWVLRELFADTGAPLDDELDLLRVEPVTRYRFADGTEVELSADLPRALDALEAWSPGAGADWTRVLGACASMWRASERFLGGPPPWPPHRPRPGDPAPDPRDLLAVRPWRTLRGLARANVRDPRLRMVVERFATYAGADPRRAPAALAVAGYVEHAFGAWHVRGGMYEIVRALVRRLEALGGELRLSTPVTGLRAEGGRVRWVEAGDALVACDALLWNGDARSVPGHESAPREPSLSGYALMLGLRGRDPERTHHEIRFPADYDAEFDDVFVHRRPVRDPTLYLSAPWVTDPADEPPDGESLFVLVNAPAAPPADWPAYEARLLDRLALGERVITVARRTPAQLGPIYGDAPHGRLGALRRPNPFPRAPKGLCLVGGTTHPGGGLPLVLLGARTVAREIGPA
jgi:phytoene desaturase